MIAIWIVAGAIGLLVGGVVYLTIQGLERLSDDKNDRDAKKALDLYRDAQLEKLQLIEDLYQKKESGQITEAQFAELKARLDNIGK